MGVFVIVAVSVAVAVAVDVSDGVELAVIVGEGVGLAKRAAKRSVIWQAGSQSTVNAIVIIQRARMNLTTYRFESAAL